MSKSKPQRGRRQRRLRVRENLRREPDLQKIASTVVTLALAQAEKDAQAQQSSSSQRVSDDA